MDIYIANATARTKKPKETQNKQKQPEGYTSTKSHNNKLEDTEKNANRHKTPDMNNLKDTCDQNKKQIVKERLEQEHDTQLPQTDIKQIKTQNYKQSH